MPSTRSSKVVVVACAAVLGLAPSTVTGQDRCSRRDFEVMNCGFAFSMEAGVPDFFQGGHAAGQAYLPEALEGERYYLPKNAGFEIKLRARLERLRTGGPDEAPRPASPPSESEER